MEKPVFVSEELEPVMAMVMGRMFARVMWEQEHGNEVTLANECDYMWYAAQAIEKLSIATSVGGGAIHFSIASMNNIGHCADIIESIMGYRPKEIA